MAVQDDVTKAVNELRAAVQELETATGRVAAHYGESVDARRLRIDVDRVRQDVDLLAGQSLSEPAAPVLQVIDDTAYPQDFWMDAEDEGLGGGR